MSCGGGSGGLSLLIVGHRGMGDQRQRRHLLHATGQRGSRNGRLWSIGAYQTRNISTTSSWLIQAAALCTHHRHLVVHGLVLAVAGAASFPAIPIDGRLQLRRRAQILFLALVRVQILHVSARCIKLLISAANRRSKRQREREKGANFTLMSCLS